MEASPKVSIIMPTYNRAGLIGETIESVMNQTYSNWELIIVDDGSTDNTEVIVAGINDERISFIEAGRTGIGGKIKNIGLEKATGELIAFNDSDDLWDKTKLEKQVAALEKHPEAGFCLTGGYNFKNLREPIDFFYTQRSGARVDDIYTSIFRSEVAVFTQALLLRKNCLATIGVFREEKSFSDFDFIVSHAKHFKAIVLYEPLVFRRIHNENYIANTWEKSYYEGEAIIRENKNYLPRRIYNDSLFRMYINYGEKWLSKQEKTKAVKYFLKAWKHKPVSFVPIRKTAKTIIHFLKGK